MFDGLTAGVLSIVTALMVACRFLSFKFRPLRVISTGMSGLISYPSTDGRECDPLNTNFMAALSKLEGNSLLSISRTPRVSQKQTKGTGSFGRLGDFSSFSLNLGVGFHLDFPPLFPRNNACSAS